MSYEFIPYTSNTKYCSNLHGTIEGQIGHKAVVKLNDGTIGIVLASNINKVKVQYETLGQTTIDWFPNENVSVRSDFIEIK